MQSLNFNEESQGTTPLEQQTIIAQDQSFKALSNINLFKSGKLQMLKETLKDQAYLDDIRYQLLRQEAVQ